MNSEMPRVPGGSRPPSSGTLASTRWTMLPRISCSPPEIHILRPLMRYCGPNGDSHSYSARVVMSDSEDPACGSDKHMVPVHSPRSCGRAKAPTCAGAPCASSSAALPMVSAGYAQAPMLAAYRRATAAFSTVTGSCMQPTASSCVAAMRPLSAKARTAAATSAGTSTRSPSNVGSCRSASWAQGANTSSASRSQLSITASKVSRECAAKRGARSSASTSSQSNSWKRRSSRETSRPVMASGHLEQARGALAAADAHGHDHVLHPATTPLDQRMADQARAAHAVGMADRDRAAVDVDPLVRDAESVHAIQDLQGEGFVELPQADVVDREPGILQQLRYREHRSDAHFVGLAAGDRIAAEHAQRADAPPRRGVGRHQHRSRGAVGKLAGVAGRAHSAGACAAELRHALERRVRAHALVGPERDLARAHRPRLRPAPR